MNYRHLYHAGSFTDVLKHLVLLQLHQLLQQKDKPYDYIDTHSGSGLYDLHSANVQRTKEYQNGIARLLEKSIPSNMTLLQQYITLIQQFNVHNPISQNTSPIIFYPGSPLLSYAILRPQDHMILNELQLEECTLLRKHCHHLRNVGIHHRNAYEFLPAILPPAAHRALILIDPPFEHKDEWQQILAVLETSLRKFPQGIYAIWYPYKQKAPEAFYQKAALLPAKAALTVEFSIAAHLFDSHALNACGMLLLNPPWQFAEIFTPTLAVLTEQLRQDQHAYGHIKWLKKEKT